MNSVNLIIFKNVYLKDRIIEIKTRNRDPIDCD